MTTIVILGCLIAIIGLASGGSRTQTAATSEAQTSISTPQEETTKTAANIEELATQRISELSFKCIEPAFCHQWPAGYHLPLFIDGLDDHLIAYLATHGYTDLWTGSGLYFFNRAGGETTTAQAIVPQAPSDIVAPGSGLDYETGDGSGFAYVSAEGNSGLIPDELGFGLTSPQDAEPGDLAEVNWKLMNSSGEVVKELQFAIQFVECSSTCEQATKDPPVSGRFAAGYSTAEYTPPPLFQF